MHHLHILPTYIHINFPLLLSREKTSACNTSIKDSKMSIIPQIYMSHKQTINLNLCHLSLIQIAIIWTSIETIVLVLRLTNQIQEPMLKSLNLDLIFLFLSISLLLYTSLFFATSMSCSGSSTYMHTHNRYRIPSPGYKILKPSYQIHTNSSTKIQENWLLLGL